MYYIQMTLLVILNVWEYVFDSENFSCSYFGLYNPKDIDITKTVKEELLFMKGNNEI